MIFLFHFFVFLKLCYYPFRFVVSTRRLLKHCVELKIMCADATYKLNWCGFPFMVIGTVDTSKTFHPLCFACCSGETTSDFEFIFKTMNDAVNELFDCEMAPEILIADGANSIRNAFMNV